MSQRGIISTIHLSSYFDDTLMEKSFRLLLNQMVRSIDDVVFLMRSDANRFPYTFENFKYSGLENCLDTSTSLKKLFFSKENIEDKMICINISQDARFSENIKQISNVLKTLPLRFLNLLVQQVWCILVDKKSYASMEFEYYNLCNDMYKFNAITVLLNVLEQIDKKITEKYLYKTLISYQKVGNSMLHNVLGFSLPSLVRKGDYFSFLKNTSATEANIGFKVTKEDLLFIASLQLKRLEFNRDSISGITESELLFCLCGINTTELEIYSGKLEDKIRENCQILQKPNNLMEHLEILFIPVETIIVSKIFAFSFRMLKKLSQFSNPPIRGSHILCGDVCAKYRYFPSRHVEPHSGFLNTKNSFLLNSLEDLPNLFEQTVECLPNLLTIDDTFYAAPLPGRLSSLKFQNVTYLSIQVGSCDILNEILNNLNHCKDNMKGFEIWLNSANISNHLVNFKNLEYLKLIYSNTRVEPEEIPKLQLKFLCIECGNYQLVKKLLKKIKSPSLDLTCEELTPQRFNKLVSQSVFDQVQYLKVQFNEFNHFKIDDFSFLDQLPRLKVLELLYTEIPFHIYKDYRQRCLNQKQVEIRIC